MWALLIVTVVWLVLTVWLVGAYREVHRPMPGILKASWAFSGVILLSGIVGWLISKL